MKEKNIIITTTDLKEDYEILDSLYVIVELKSTYPKEEYLNQMLNVVKERLKEQCRRLGGDAIICCRTFTVDYALSMDGTAVKIKSKN